MIFIEPNDPTSAPIFPPIMKFPNGEKRYMVPKADPDGIVDITMAYEDDSEFFDLLCIFDSIRRNNPNAEFGLTTDSDFEGDRLKIVFENGIAITMGIDDVRSNATLDAVF